MKKRRKKEGWFEGRGYRHFDRSINFDFAKKLVTIPSNIIHHGFLPLISYNKSERRFKGLNEDGTPKVRHKNRLICYASHQDTQIYAYYAYNLENYYARLRKELGIDDCVLAYRPGKGCNIDMANAAFEQIKKLTSCSVITIDIKGFFDNISHAMLKKQWCRVLRSEKLPEDHYKLFKSLTKFSRIDRKACLTVLGLNESDLRKSTEPLCSIGDFQQKICERVNGYKKIVLTNSDGRNENGSLKWRSHGIPQGTPISAILSNISMIDFDIYMNNLANSNGAVYWRYCDDIFIICPTMSEEFFEAEIEKKLKEQGATLEINKDKTEFARFTEINNKKHCLLRKKDGKWVIGSIQYLGLSFDGKNKRLRNSTIARYQRKVKYAVRNAGRTDKYFQKDKIRSRKLHLMLTDIGAHSMPSYAARVSKITGDPAAKKQLRAHKRTLNTLIKMENKKF